MPAPKRPSTRAKRPQNPAPSPVSRAEFDKVIIALDIQFKRIAQIQAELDVIRKAWDESGGKKLR